MIALITLMPLLLSAADGSAAGKWTQLAEKGKTLYATLKTSEGDVVVKLYSTQTPITVANFVGLASGEKEWTLAGEKTHKPLYDGTKFHRVIEGFMVQGGDPLGTGSGDPGFFIADEFGTRKFDQPGLVAMANTGRPSSNGSQFFITVSTPHYLDGKYSVFGEVVAGYPVVEKISKLPKSGRERLAQDVILKQVVLSEKAPKKAAVSAPSK